MVFQVADNLREYSNIENMVQILLNIDAYTQLTYLNINKQIISILKSSPLGNGVSGSFLFSYLQLFEKFYSRFCPATMYSFYSSQEKTARVNTFLRKETDTLKSFQSRALWLAVVGRGWSPEFRVCLQIYKPHC